MASTMKRRRPVFVRAYSCLRHEVRIWVKAHFRPVSFKYKPDQLFFAI